MVKVFGLSVIKTQAEASHAAATVQTPLCELLPQIEEHRST